jgi:hypothetical protein
MAARARADAVLDLGPFGCRGERVGGLGGGLGGHDHLVVELAVQIGDLGLEGRNLGCARGPATAVRSGALGTEPKRAARLVVGGALGAVGEEEVVDATEPGHQRATGCGARPAASASLRWAARFAPALVDGSAAATSRSPGPAAGIRP